MQLTVEQLVALRISVRETDHALPIDLARAVFHYAHKKATTGTMDATRIINDMFTVSENISDYKEGIEVLENLFSGQVPPEVLEPLCRRFMTTLGLDSSREMVDAVKKCLTAEIDDKEENNFDLLKVMGWVDDVLEDGEEE